MHILKSRALSQLAQKLALGAFIFASQAHAGPFGLRIPAVEGNTVGQAKLYLYGNQPTAADQVAFKLFDMHASTLDQSVSDFIRDRLRNSAITVRSSSGLSLAGSEESDHVDYDFVVNGVPFCDMQVRAHRVRGLNAPVVMGRIPDVDTNGIPPLSDWPTGEQALESVRSYLNGIQKYSSLQLDSASRCIAIDGVDPVAVWRMIVIVDRLPYSVLAGEKVFRMNPRHFDVTGTAKVYDTNPFDGTLTDFTIGRLTGDGTLTSDVFTTEPVGTDRVSSASHKFVYDVKEKGFDETSVFVHATEALEWFTGLGFKNTAKRLIRLKPHAVINGEKNNALYIPETSTAGSSIQIGDGDGITLQNLPKDADVVSHEFGHHVIFRTLKDVTGESLVIHEGLADFFTFARTGNACLGESICPVGSAIPCEVAAQCLRTAENEFRYGDSDLPKEAHRRSQFLSGMLWDLKKAGEVPANELIQITFKAVDYFLESSSYHDLVLSMLMADRALYDGKHGCTIYNAAVDRGLSGEIADFSCDGSLPALTASSTSSSTTSSKPIVKSSGSSSKSGCAVIGNNDLGKTQLFGVYLLIFLLPLLFVKTQSKLRRQVLRHESRPAASRRRTTQKF